MTKAEKSETIIKIVNWQQNGRFHIT